MPVWTIGYEGRDAAMLLLELKRAGIGRVVDVRQRPSSRKRGLSKGPLSALLEREGIRYTHMPELGVVKEVRDPYKAGGDWAPFATWYREHLRGEAEAVERLRAGCGEERVCLLCFERDPAQCHRSLLVEALGLEAQDL